MSSNPLPWLVLAGIIALVLAFKGYLKPPASWARQPANKPFTGPDAVQSPNQMQADPRSSYGSDLDRYDARDLGIAFARAARREAEQSLHRDIAFKHLDEMMATFQSPFVAPPAPPAAGSDPAKAAVNPF